MSSKADLPSSDGFAAAAWQLRCAVAAVRAVAAVEAGSEGAFLDSGEPVVLFEPHVFHRLTDGRFIGRIVPGAPRDEHGDPVRWAYLSYPTWRPGWYGPTSVQHRRLDAAAKLSRPAALMSASWGLFQILGENHERCGYPDLQRFVTAMYREVDDHLRAFVAFIRADKRLVDAIRALPLESAARAFARVYNGPRYEANRYHVRIIEAFAAAAA